MIVREDVLLFCCEGQIRLREPWWKAERREGMCWVKLYVRKKGREAVLVRFMCWSNLGIQISTTYF